MQSIYLFLINNFNGDIHTINLFYVLIKFTILI